MVRGDRQPLFLAADGLLVNLGKVSFMEAFDVLFKSHFVFNVHYALALKYFYNFFEKYIFKVKNSKALPSVSTLHVDLTNTEPEEENGN